MSAGCARSSSVLPQRASTAEAPQSNIPDSAANANAVNPRQVDWGSCLAKSQQKARSWNVVHHCGQFRYRRTNYICERRWDARPLPFNNPHLQESIMVNVTDISKYYPTAHSQGIFAGRRGYHR